MEQQTKESISHIARQIVVDAYGLPTCTATVKVLKNVLDLGWGVELSPHVVSLKVVPREAFEISKNETLSIDEKQRLISRLPAGKRPISIESSKNEMKFHIVGLTQLKGKGTFWDPSIDQVNQELDSCQFGPLVIPMSHSEIDADGNIRFVIDGCFLAYKETNELEEEVYSLGVWRDDYSDLVADALRKCSNKGLRGMLRNAAHP